MTYLELASALGINGFIANKELRSVCPIHNDTNPSFSINLETGLWYCFAGCGGGDFMRLVELVLDCSPQEAHDWLQTGNATSVDQLEKSLSMKLSPPTPIPEVDSGNFWQITYAETTAEFMAKWFLDRGFTWDTIFKWGIHYDKIMDAVIIPVIWEKQVLGTITRNTVDYLPKYQNSPGLPKTKLVFGEIKAATTEIILVEGVLDAIWLWQLGYNAVAILGTYLSKEQIHILERYRFGEIILALDNDEPGRLGTVQALGKLTKAGWLLPQITFIKFPDKRKDPQDCSKEEFKELFSNRKGLIHELKF
jgi:DNA primase